MSAWIIEGVEGQVGKLMTSSFGCRIIQKAIKISDAQSLQRIHHEILGKSYDLCKS